MGAQIREYRQRIRSVSATKKIIFRRRCTTTMMRMRQVGQPSREAIQARRRGAKMRFRPTASRKMPSAMPTW